MFCAKLALNETRQSSNRKKLTNAVRTLIYEIFLEIYYKKNKKIIYIYIFIYHKNGNKVFLK